MDRPSSKRSRSSDSFGRRSSQSGDGTESTVSRDAKYSAYKDINYAVVLETKNSFMRVSKAGIVDEDRTLCHRLLLADQPIPHESMFDDDRFEEFHSILQGRSEARVYLDLHPLLVPSAENLFISGQTTVENLVQGYNDPWVKAIPFYGPRPQPDHTVGFRWSTFTNEQRWKLGIDPTAKSCYTAREDIYFPFLTSEIKCGKQALDLADRQNAHSMTIAVRAVVELFRKVGRAMEVHRNILGFSISHDDKTVRIYGHYPEIDGESTAYYRSTIKEFSYSNDDGKERWTPYRFTRNVYEIFVPTHLERIKSAVDQLQDSVVEPLNSTLDFDEEYALSSQDVVSSGPESQAQGVFLKPGTRKAGGINAELRTMIQSLQQQLEQQRKESEQQRQEAKQQLEQQREEVKQREEILMAQLEQQRKDSEQQRKELMLLLNQQSEQLKQLLGRQ